MKHSGPGFVISDARSVGTFTIREILLNTPFTGGSGSPGGHSQPFSVAIRAASARVAAPVLPIAPDR